MRRSLALALLVVAAGVILAQEPPPPLSAAVRDPGYTYAPSGAFTVCVNHACIVANPAGTHYQFRRTTVLASTPMDSTTEALAETCFTFVGAGDGEIFEYSVRAILDDDTSFWSDPVRITHDLEPPEWVPYVIAQHCCSGGECAIYVTWQRAGDFALGVNGSEVRGYGIYRSPTPDGVPIDLGYITPTTPALAFVPSDGSEIYSFVDTLITPGETYHYIVVAFDSAGYPSAGIGHFQHFGNQIVSASAVGPGVCDLPLQAVLKPVPPVIDSLNYRVEIDDRAVWLTFSRMYQFVLEDISCGTADTTPWTNLPYYEWSLRDGHRYNFYARIRDDVVADTSDWFVRGPMLVDMSPPLGVDSLVASVEGSTIVVNFYVSEEGALDCLTDECGTHCGVGLMVYRLYRVNYDSLDSFFPYNPAGDEAYLLHIYTAADTWRTDTSFYFRDDGSVLPLEDNETYLYIVITVDSLGHYSMTPYFGSYDTATADLGITDPALVSLPTWSTGDCVTLQIIDSSRCDYDSIYIQQASNPEFTAGLHTYGPYWIHDSILGNPDDGNCNDWDTLTFQICGLEEAQYYFRVWAVDHFGNVSNYSNVVNTRFDNTPPQPRSVDSIRSLAVCTDQVKIKVCWHKSYDAGIGMGSYQLYRSDTPGDLGELITTIDHNPLTEVYCFEDADPNPRNNFRDNYYTIITVDNFGNQVQGTQIGFREGTPPCPVRIDTVYPEFIDGEMYVVIEWSDTTPPDYGSGGMGNAYRVEHAADSSWLCLGDPDIITIEEPTYSHRLVLPRSIIVGSPHRFFHIATIDAYGNESGYSVPYHYVDSSWVADSMVVHLYHGWNMVGLPILPRSTNYRDVFPSALGALTYTAGAGYSPVDELEIGYGYWIYNPGDMDIMIHGYHIPYVTRVLPVAGYYMVSGITDTTWFDLTPEEALAMGSLIWFNPLSESYELATTLEPGKGYWILVSDSCEYSVPEGMFGRVETEPAWSVELRAGTQQLIIGAGSDALDLAMPPAPPEVVLPALVDGDRRMIRDISADGVWQVEIPERTTLRWNPKEVPAGLVLYAGGGTVDMTAVGQVALEPGIYRIAFEGKSALPQKLDVLAHPNPFNSRVSVNISVPASEDVSVAIYSADGKLVTTLWRGELSAGAHNFIWDGTDDTGGELPGGVYFIKATTGTKSVERSVLFIR